MINEKAHFYRIHSMFYQIAPELKEKVCTYKADSYEILKMLVNIVNRQLYGMYLIYIDKGGGIVAATRKFTGWSFKVIYPIRGMPESELKMRKKKK